jgi:hypothetical protein
LNNLPVHGELWINSRTDFVESLNLGLDSINFNNKFAIKRKAYFDPTLGGSNTNLSMLFFSGIDLIELGYKYKNDMDTLDQYDILYNKSDSIWNQSSDFPDSIYTLDSITATDIPETNLIKGLGVYYSSDLYNWSTENYESTLLDNYSSIIYAKLTENIIIKLQLTDTKTYKYPREFVQGIIDSVDMLSDVKLLFTIAEGSEFPLSSNSIKINYNDYLIQKISKNHSNWNKNISIFDAKGRLLCKTSIFGQNISDNNFMEVHRKLPQQIYFIKTIDNGKHQYKKINNLNGPK